MFTSSLTTRQMDDMTTAKNANKNVVKPAATHNQPLVPGGSRDRAEAAAVHLPSLGSGPKPSIVELQGTQVGRGLSSLEGIFDESGTDSLFHGQNGPEKHRRV